MLLSLCHLKKCNRGVYCPLLVFPHAVMTVKQRSSVMDRSLWGFKCPLGGGSEAGITTEEEVDAGSDKQMLHGGFKSCF